MKPFTYAFTVDQNQAVLFLETPIQDPLGAYRLGRLTLDNGRSMELFARHSVATTALTYLHKIHITNDYRQLLKLPDEAENQVLEAPAQLVLGTQRAQLLAQGIRDFLHTPALNTALTQTEPEKMAIVPIAKEGTQFDITNNLRTLFGYACAELPITVRQAVPPEPFALSFQDQSILDVQRERMFLSLLCGNVYDGRAHVAILDFLCQHFKNLSHVELLAPQASLQGLTHLLAQSNPGLTLRAHVFETLLDGDTHFPHPEFHIHPSLSKNYRAWWGRDPQGFSIATMPCINPDSSIPLLDPVRQIRLLNALLKERHRVTLSGVFKRHVFPPILTVGSTEL